MHDCDLVASLSAIKALVEWASLRLLDLDLSRKALFTFLAHFNDADSKGSNKLRPYFHPSSIFL